MYDAWKKKVMPDTSRIYYMDTWFLSQNLPYYPPDTLTSFTSRILISAFTVLFLCSMFFVFQMDHHFLAGKYQDVENFADDQYECMA